MSHLLREYSVPFLVAIIGHAILAFSLHKGWHPGLTPKEIVEPKSIQTSLIFRERKPRSIVVAPENQPVVQISKPEPEPAKPVSKERPLKETRPSQNQIVEHRQEAERQKRITRISEEAFQRQLQDEAESLQREAIEDASIQYVNNIYAQIVSYWSRPPSARNGMSATIRVELFPDGMLNTVSVERTSGNEAFDRSALEAVSKVPSFSVPEDAALFNARFRSFTLIFKPEDLLR